MIASIIGNARNRRGGRQGGEEARRVELERREEVREEEEEGEEGEEDDVAITAIDDTSGMSKAEKKAYLKNLKKVSHVYAHKYLSQFIHHNAHPCVT